MSKDLLVDYVAELEARIVALEELAQGGVVKFSIQDQKARSEVRKSLFKPLDTDAEIVARWKRGGCITCNSVREDAERYGMYQCLSCLNGHADMNDELNISRLSDLCDDAAREGK